MPIPMHEDVSQVAHSDRNEDRPASARPSEASSVELSRVTGQPRFTSRQKPDATPLVSATVYLLPESSSSSNGFAPARTDGSATLFRRRSMTGSQEPAGSTSGARAPRRSHSAR